MRSRDTFTVPRRAQAAGRIYRGKIDPETGAVSITCRVTAGPSPISELGLGCGPRMRPKPDNAPGGAWVYLVGATSDRFRDIQNYPKDLSGTLRQTSVVTFPLPSELVLPPIVPGRRAVCGYLGISDNTAIVTGSRDRGEVT